MSDQHRELSRPSGVQQSGPVEPALTPPPMGGLFTMSLLSVMMFLQFFVWGAWFVVLGPYMGGKGFDATAIGNAYSTAPIAAILAPLVLGMVADRFFPSQVVLGVLHLLGGVLLMLAPAAVGDGTSPWLFIGVLLAHMVCYMPTLGLSNTVAFHAMTRPEKQFPFIRVWGTIGWIVAGFFVAQVIKAMVPETAELTGDALNAARQQAPQFFYVAGVAGVVLGVFSFFLPSTQPPLKGKPFSLGSALGLDAISLLRDRNFAVFLAGSLLICIPLAAYYQQAASYLGLTGAKAADVPQIMTFGQMSEIGFMLVMPLFFARLGVKWMLAVGMLAWVVRYAMFSGAWGGADGGHVMWLVIGGIILHGICYDFFFVTGQIYTEQKSGAAIRAQAQSLLVLVTQGVGMLIGNQLFGWFVSSRTTDGVTDWTVVWAAPTVFALAVLVGFVLLFKGGSRRGDAPGA